MTMLPMNNPIALGGSGIGSSVGLLGMPNIPNNIFPMISPISALRNKYVQQAMSPAMMFAQRPELMQYVSPLAMLMKQTGGNIQPLSFLSPFMQLMGRNPTDNDLNFMQGVLPNLSNIGCLLYTSPSPRD